MTNTLFRFRDIAVAAFGSSLFISTGDAAVLPKIALSARADGDFSAAARAMSSIGGPRRIGTFVGPFPGAGAVHAVGRVQTTSLHPTATSPRLFATLPSAALAAAANVLPRLASGRPRAS
jgi:hypothetical protein